jgi:hypothetical protein
MSSTMLMKLRYLSGLCPWCQQCLWPRGSTLPHLVPPTEELIEITRHLVPGGHLGELGLLLWAARHGEGAARMEATAGWRVERAGHFATEHDVLPLLIGVGGERGGEERLGVGMKRLVTQLEAVGDLDDPP